MMYHLPSERWMRPRARGERESGARSGRCVSSAAAFAHFRTSSADERRKPGARMAEAYRVTAGAAIGVSQHA